MLSETERIEAAVKLTSGPEMKDIYTLWYRTGGNPRPLEKHFVLKDTKDFRDVVSRCKSYCDNCGYRFVKVERFLSDLAADEILARSSG